MCVPLLSAGIKRSAVAGDFGAEPHDMLQWGLGTPLWLLNTPPGPICLRDEVRQLRGSVSWVSSAPGFIVAIGRIYLLWSKSLF